MQLGALQSLLSLLHSDMITSEQCTPGMAIVASMHERLLTLSHGTLSAWSTNSGNFNIYYLNFYKSKYLKYNINLIFRFNKCFNSN